MKTYTHYLCFSIISLSFFSLKAQYLPQCYYLQNPDDLVVYIEDCADFWVDNAYDETYGGFFVDISRNGSVLNNSYKTTVSQSRDAYGLARAFMVTGDESYLTKARSAVDFLTNHLWDAEYGGWFNQCNRDGSNPYLGNKTAFDQHYGKLGLVAYYEATADMEILTSIENSFNFMDDYMWDDRTDYLGYYNEVTRTGGSPLDKTFNSTADAITTHLYNLYLLTGKQSYLDRLLVMKENLQEYFVGSMPQQAIGFAEAFNSDWEIDNTEERTIMGHVLKAAWCLGRIYRVEEDAAALQDAEELVADVLDNGYDHEYGGPYKDYNRLTGEMYMYGAYDTAKAWWQMEQAVTSGLVLYEITNNTNYLQMADESLGFFMDYFVDDTYGEVYADRSRTGGRVYYSGGYWDENKGSGWKAAYHSIETAYYAYLYGKLIVNHEPLTLYYRYDAAVEERTINMTPMSIDFSKLEIESVTQNGSNYGNFDATKRTLTLPVGESGLFAVTYIYTGDVGVENRNNNQLVLHGNYPNPFKEDTHIDLSMKRAANVAIQIFNAKGQLIKQIEQGELEVGRHRIEVNGSSFITGLYYYKVITNECSVIGKFIKAN